MRALIVVDVQNDFCEGGSLAVEGGIQAAKNISEYIKEYSDCYSEIILTADAHIDPGWHFASKSETEPNYVDTWPNHCVKNTEGYEFCSDLIINRKYTIFEKGNFVAAYSGFEGYEVDGNRNLLVPKINLEKYLRDRYILFVDICGIAFDYCVKATSNDAAEKSFHPIVVNDLCPAVNETKRLGTITELVRKGAFVCDLEDMKKINNTYLSWIK